MTVLNPEYKPMSALYKAKQAFQTKWDCHQTESLDCLSRYQYKTVQDAAKTLFYYYNPNMGVRGKGIIHQIDPETFSTLDEVFKAWSKAREISKQTEADEKNSLPVGKPNGEDIFTETGENYVSSVWQSFGPEEIGYNNFMEHGGFAHTLVTVDNSDKEINICFMQDPNHSRGGRYVEYEIEALATAMYNRAIINHNNTKKVALEPINIGSFMKGALSKVLNAAATFVGMDNAPRPQQFNFYVHHRSWYLSGEIFYKIEMDFKNGGFKKTGFERFDVVPKIIQDAYSQVFEPLATPSDTLRLEK